MNKLVTPALTNLSNVTIDKFHIDTQNDIIKLNFINNSISEIVFKDVTSFYYMDNDDEISSEEHDNISLNNIMYCSKGIEEIMNLPDSEEGLSVSVPNFVLELSDSSIFIEADSITIDKQKYLV